MRFSEQRQKEKVLQVFSKKQAEKTLHLFLRQPKSVKKTFFA
jgi:hypothetical protein